ncbi:MAG: hypothetical protein EPGJADBJ_03802 [Saprospiraceae bacterium]|nr:hypothetical protein [Saprospiraceae bacterium]
MTSSLLAWSQTRFSSLYDYNNQYQVAFTILELQNGGYLIGSKNIGPEYSDNKLLLHRLDALGNEIWQKEINKEGYIYYLDFGAMLRLPDGNYLLAGDYKEIITELYDVFLIKIDTSGNVLWEKTYGTSDKNDFFGNFALTPDSTYIQVCGQTRRTDASGNIWLFKTDLDGEVIWDEEISQTGWQHGQHLAMLNTGSFWLASRYETADLSQYKVYKINDSGQSVWEHKLGSQYDDSGFPKIVALPDGSSIFTGAVGTTDWRVHLAYAVKLSPSGEIVWEKTYHTGFSSSAFAQPVVLEDGSAILSGSVDFDTLSSPRYARFWKINAEGDMIWEQIHHHNPDSNNIDAYIYHQISTSDEGIAGVGFSYDWNTLQDIWILKLDSDGCLIENCMVSAVEPEEEVMMDIYPNPATEEVFVLLPDDFEAAMWNITDVFGQVLRVVATHAQGSPIRIDVSQLPAGLYWLQTFDAEARMSTKPFQVIR